jgi:hypothetical protein
MTLQQSPELAPCSEKLPTTAAPHCGALIRRVWKMTAGESQSGQRRSSVIGCSALLRCNNALRRVMFLPFQVVKQPHVANVR